MKKSKAKVKKDYYFDGCEPIAYEIVSTSYYNPDDTMVRLHKLIGEVRLSKSEQSDKYLWVQLIDNQIKATFELDQIVFMRQK